VQLWTLRNELAEDLAGTLGQVARIGYSAVELWLPEYPAAGELASILRSCSLKAISAHVPLEQLRDNFAAVAEYYRVLGIVDLVIPYIDESQRQTEEQWKQRLREIASIAPKCQAEGFRLSYHHHDFEFADRIGGVEVHDVIFSTIDASLLKAELDTYFLHMMGKDPTEYICKYADRVPFLHLKDQKPGSDENTEVGAGVIDWQAVHVEACRSHVEWYIVEQDCGPSPPFESIGRSLRYLRACGIVL